MTWRRTAFVGTIALVLAVGAGVAINWRPLAFTRTEARVWRLLSGPSSGTFGNYRLSQDARNEIKELGTNAIPCLLHALDITAAPSRLDRFIGRHPMLPAWFTSRYRPRWEVAAHAADAFGSLGPQAAPAFPGLLERLSNPATAEAAGACLMAIGPGAKSTVPALLVAIQNTNGATRSAASSALIGIDPETANHAGVR